MTQPSVGSIVGAVAAVALGFVAGRLSHAPGPIENPTAIQPQVAPAPDRAPELTERARQTPSRSTAEVDALHGEIDRLTALVERLSSSSALDQEVAVLGALETGIPFDDRLPDAYHPPALRQVAEELETWLAEQEYDPTARLVELECESAPCILAVSGTAIEHEGGGWGSNTEFNRAVSEWMEERGYPRHMLNHSNQAQDHSQVSSGVFLPDDFREEQPDAAALFRASFDRRRELIIERHQANRQASD